MRILVVGAGGIGGYFGGRLLEAGRDVTFLVRPKRGQQLAKTGLVIRSRTGDVSIANPKTVLAEELREPYDLVLLSCKAYDLDSAIASFAPAVGPDTLILPLLNGMRHLDILDRHFGEKRVLGGLCVISVAVNERGEIVHLNELHSLTCGVRDGKRAPALDAIVPDFSGCKFDFGLSETILKDMWEKWVFIAAGAGITCLMRATVGHIVTAGASQFGLDMLNECASIAALHGFPPGSKIMQMSRDTLTAPGSDFTASMLRDIERGAHTEADHILGDLLERSEGHPTPILKIAYAHVKAYEARRERERKP